MIYRRDGLTGEDEGVLYKQVGRAASAVRKRSSGFFPALFISIYLGQQVYLLYVDESGDPLNPQDENFVLAGIAVFERQTYWLSQQLDALETEIFGPPPAPEEATPFPRPVEFHASSIHARKTPPWDSLTSQQATNVLRRISTLVTDSHESCALFGIVIHRPSYPEEDPVVFAFSELTRRFDLFLARLHAKGNTQRGLMVFDKSRHEQRLQTLLRTYTQEGGPFGRLHNFSDVPLFADSTVSRLVQLGDFVAWATFRRYERSVANYFDQIVRRFDYESGRMHGLYHRTGDFQNCFCPACQNRRETAQPLRS